MNVSILIPCFNAEQWISEAIESALGQDSINAEVIVVDDGSTDSSLEEIRAFGDAIQFESGPNQGGNVARNRLLELASGEWLQYLDADDYLDKEKVSRQLDEARNLNSADVLWSPSVYEYWEDDQVSEHVTQDLEDEDPWVALIRWRLSQTGASLWKASTLRAVGGWKPDQPRCQEHELYLRLLMHGANFQFCPSALSYYRQWSLDTVCRKDPTLTTRTRMEIVTAAERFLEGNDLLTQDRKEAAFATRMQCARSVFNNDAQFARSLAQLARQHGRKLRLPAEPWFPRLYRTLFHTFGFTFAESVAAMARGRQKP
ncbi:MAG: glycosyltransferase [Planctomycetaceae bacterium]|nr:glycosyltransferase [Planctomycetaceae bacterium]